MGERLGGREILGLTLGLDAAPGMEPRDARERLHVAWVALVEDITAAAPAVMFVEDVHWAEPSLLDLLHHLAGHVAGPLLLIVTARPEYAETHPDALGSRRHERVLWLDRLAGEHVDRIAERILGEPPTAALRDVLAAAEGNPFFVEELLAALRERGQMIPSRDGWRLAGTAGQPPLPDTVRAALTARLDCLGPVARATLQAAAVVGRVFPAQDVVRLLEPVHADLAELVDRDLVRRQPRGRAEPHPTYTFKHALTRQVAYDLLPAPRRARLHARLADLLAEGGNLDDRVPLVAHHYAESARADLADLAWPDDPDTLARLRDNAVTWLGRAGELATRRFALDEALALLHRALDLASDPRTRAALWRAVGEVHTQSWDYPAFQAAMTRALEASGDPQDQAAAYVGLASAVTDWGIISAALPDDDTVEGWIERALALSAPVTPARAHAMALRAVWAPEPLAEMAPRVMIAAESADDLRVLGQAHGMQEILACTQRRYSDVLDWAMRLVARFESQDPRQVGDAYLHPIGALMALGRFTEARDFAARNEAVAVRQGNSDRAVAVAWWAEVESMAEEWPRVGMLEERIRAFAGRDDIGPTARFVRAPLLCAAARAHLGDARQSTELERLTADLTGGADDDRLAAPYLRLALARGDLDRVGDLMARAPKRLRPWAQWWALDLDVTRLDALAALEDAAAVESEAAALLGDNRFLDAVARRALGTVRRDPHLLGQAGQAFTDMGLPAHARRCSPVPPRPAGSRRPHG